MGCVPAKLAPQHSAAEDFKDVVKFDQVEADYKGDGTVFYEGINSLSKFVPFLLENPHVSLLIESHSKCPDGKCRNELCSNRSDDRCENIISYFRNHGCRNNFTSKSWGCTHEQIKAKDLVRISVVPKEEEKTEIEEAPDVEALRAREEEVAKRLAALEAAEIALQARISAAKAAEEAKKKDFAKEMERMEAEAQQKLAEALAAAEKQRQESESAAEEAQRKRLAFAAAAEHAELQVQASMAAAQEAERRRVAAEEAAHLAERQKEAFVKAAEEAEKQRQEDAIVVESIRRDIEEALKEQIEFVKNKAELTAQGQAICEKIIPFLRRMPKLVIHIESHTNCFRGKCDEGCNLMELSQERVDSVMEYFLAAGCRNKFVTKGWGCKHPELQNVRLVRIFPEHSEPIVTSLPTEHVARPA